MKSKPDKDLLMRDFAHTDPRSVRAGLEGRGDGRAERYERYCSQHLTGKTQHSSNEVLQAGFRAAHLEQYGDRRVPLLGYLRVIVPLVGLAAGVTLFHLMTT